MNQINDGESKTPVLSSMDTPLSEKSFRSNVLNTKTPTAILLFYKRIMLQDVTGIILQFWWELFYCSYVHKYCSNFVFAARHVMDSKSKEPIELFKCKKCGNIEYTYENDNWWKYISNFSLFPWFPNSLRISYHSYIVENVRRNNEIFIHEKYMFIKSFSMKKFQNLLGSKPLEWNEAENILCPYYKTSPKKTFDYDLENRIKRKREETDDLFNKRIKFF